MREGGLDEQIKSSRIESRTTYFKLPTAAIPSTLPCHNIHVHSDNEVAAAAVLMYEPS